MKIIILAAGYAVRLHPLTLNTPKPLLKVGGKTILDRIISKTDRLGGRDGIYIITNAKFHEKLEDWASSSYAAGRIKVINDGTVSNESRLGAIRDLDIVVEGESIDEDILVLAGDNVFDLDLKDFIKFASSRTDAAVVALYDVKDKALARNFGVVAIDPNGVVVDFEEKPPEPKSTLISTGIYYFPKNKLSKIKEYVKMQDKLDAPGYYIKWLAGADRVYGFRFVEDWHDIGSIESYRKADMEYTEKERRNGKA